MTDRVVARWARVRTVAAILVGMGVLVLGGVWLEQATDRASVVDRAPKTAAAQKARADGRESQVEVEESASATRPGVRDCGIGEPVQEPAFITLDCANAGRVASGIHWDAYESDGAAGTGVVQVSGGAGAVAGKSFPARLRLFGPKNVDGLMAFTALEVTYTGATPTGKSMEVFSIA
ncbi:hypothetical protein BLA24_19730 [Streptomyces cinnamoneus]|uniref:Uncharacterized protein n=1 Tax=Streptomyces cinnamoneus TaxID=53446 RepID=A0A2G1XF59_STRCJ|nr:hypothetical protein [Streptomyces cinnamoneus]PHQ49872.1 hypothetical protein BLA24_19730 [Streptomyces cinnamoneus]PPT13352.1 hypothetical protein CYQ11_11060 [Streptomyces cinnamoneus]